MNDLNDMGRDPPHSAAERLAEMKQLFRQARDLLALALDEIGQPTAETPKALRKRFDDLFDAHLKAVAAEDAFDAQTGETGDKDVIDYDEIRAELGRQLDRIRDSGGSDAISGEAE